VDTIDLCILETLQRDAELTNIALAEQINLSPAACLRRVQKLRNSGVLQRLSYQLDRAALGLGIMAFVSLRAHVEAERESNILRAQIEQMSEVLGFFRTSGDTDYILIVVTRDMESYNLAYQRIVGLVDVQSVTSNFVMEEFKFTSELPLDEADPK
jgi:Lrp/AsnC family transcriptional regulator